MNLCFTSHNSSLAPGRMPPKGLVRPSVHSWRRSHREKAHVSIKVGLTTGNGTLPCVCSTESRRAQRHHGENLTTQAAKAEQTIVLRQQSTSGGGRGVGYPSNRMVRSLCA